MGGSDKIGGRKRQRNTHTHTRALIFNLILFLRSVRRTVVSVNMITRYIFFPTAGALCSLSFLLNFLHNISRTDSSRPASPATSLHTTKPPKHPPHRTHLVRPQFRQYRKPVRPQKGQKLHALRIDRPDSARAKCYTARVFSEERVEEYVSPSADGWGRVVLLKTSFRVVPTRIH